MNFKNYLVLVLLLTTHIISAMDDFQKRCILAQNLENTLQSSENLTPEQKDFQKECLKLFDEVKLLLCAFPVRFHVEYFLDERRDYFHESTTGYFREDINWERPAQFKPKNILVHMVLPRQAPYNNFSADALEKFPSPDLKLIGGIPKTSLRIFVASELDVDQQ